MGPPDRLTFGLLPGFGLLLTFARFPYALTVTLTVGCFWISVGIGPDYLEADKRAAHIDGVKS